MRKMEESMNRKTILKLLFVILLWNAVPAAAQTTMFTHRGNLGFAANGNYDFELKLFDTETIGTGAQQGATLQRLNVAVTNGEFTLTGIDFGAAAFTGDQLFLETAYRLAGGGIFTVLSPRQKITAVYTNRSLSAAMADAATNATQLGGLPASGYIQNTSSQQAGSFNVAGDGTADGTTQLCRNPANEIATCSSSMRYKTNLAPFHSGLSVVKGLQPITFNWKANGEADLGMGAEDVARVEPLLVTRNEKGEVEGVKYDRIAVVRLNVVKEQQQQIKRQAEQIQSQQRVIEDLKRLVCRNQSKAEVCKEAV
jgi:hypothetical protein